MKNKRIDRDSTSGCKGVTWDKATGKWLAQIMKNQKRIHLGYFTSKEEAIKTYQTKDREFFGEFYCEK